MVVYKNTWLLQLVVIAGLVACSDTKEPLNEESIQVDLHSENVSQSVPVGSTNAQGSAPNTIPGPVDKPYPNKSPLPEPKELTVPYLQQGEFNAVQSAYLLDADATKGLLNGSIIIELKHGIDVSNMQHHKFDVYWLDENNVRVGDAIFRGELNENSVISFPSSFPIPIDVNDLELVTVSALGEVSETLTIRFHDLQANHSVTGKGGNYEEFWTYGDDKPELQIYEDGGICYFDNGLLAVNDIKRQRDLEWLNLPTPRPANTIRYDSFPTYSFDCSSSSVHELDALSDDFGIWTYSSVNDAMYFGTEIYKTLTAVLKEPPHDDKMHFRVHYNFLGSFDAFWDGGYINLSDGYPYYYSMAQLDVMAHEIAHGVLVRISALGPFERALSNEMGTLHEAFSDLTGVYVKHMAGEDDVWLHAKGNGFYDRHLNEIRTQYSSIPSYLDYDEIDRNYYRGIGVITYPFYLLSQEYGIPASYELMLLAARHCWQPDHSLVDYAQCFVEVSEQSPITKASIVAAFQTVKIALVEDMLLAHYEFEISSLQVQFTETAITSNSTVQWQWDFGDGNQSTEQNPIHDYSESGSYQVTLTVTEASGAQDSYFRLIKVD